MIIDFHTHIFPSCFRERRNQYFQKEPAFKLLYEPDNAKLVGCKELLENMDQEGIDKSVVFGFPWREADHFKRNNDYIIESVQKYPDRLIGFGCFDPNAKGSQMETERCLKNGLKGIGELAVYDSDLSEEMIKGLQDIMDISLDHRTPLLLHTNEPIGHEYPGKTSMTLKQVYRFIKAYPENKIILAHWGGGLFFFNLMKKDVNEAFKNVWFDTAASPFLYHSDIYKISVGLTGPEKILFGSDYPLIKPSRYFKEMQSSGISNDDAKMIKGENAAGLLGLG